MSLSEMLHKNNPIGENRNTNLSSYERLVERNTELVDENKEKDREIERLNTDKEQLNSLVNSCQEEIRRLNNIINELEESLKDDKEEYKKDLDIETKELYNEYWRGYSICADKNLEYLQELKGSGSNDYL